MQQIDSPPTNMEFKYNWLNMDKSRRYVSSINTYILIVDPKLIGISKCMQKNDDDDVNTPALLSKNAANNTPTTKILVFL